MAAREQARTPETPGLVEPPLPIPGDVGLRRALAAGSTMRLAATVAAVGCMAATGVVTARALGPDGKGIVSTLSYLVAISASVTTLGLGEAAVVLHGRRRMTLPAATSVAVTGTLIAGAAGMVVIALTGSVLADSLWFGFLAALAVPTTALMQSLMRLAEGGDRLGFAGLAHVLFAATTLAMAVLLLLIIDMGVEGALLALAAGPLVACVVLAREGRVLRRGRRSGARNLTRGDVLTSLRIGLPMMGANALRILSRRVDGLLVFGLRGAAEAGIYSVALTIGEIALYAPGAVALAAFPRLAKVDSGREANSLVAELNRVTVVLTSCVALGLAVVSPVVIPGAFGGGFTGAVWPAILLLLGAPAISTQWLLGRALAAQGHPGTLFWSGAVTTVSMVALDVVLVPPFGAAGAAAASGLASAVGCAMSVVGARRYLPDVPLLLYVPGRPDVARVIRHVATRLSLRRLGGIAR